MKTLFNISFYMTFIIMVLALAGGVVILAQGTEASILIGIATIANALLILLPLTFIRLVERHLCKIEKHLRPSR